MRTSLLDFIGGQRDLEAGWRLPPSRRHGQEEADYVTCVIAQLDCLRGLTEPTTGFRIERISNHQSVLAKLS